MQLDVEMACHEWQLDIVSKYVWIEALFFVFLCYMLSNNDGAKL